MGSGSGYTHSPWPWYLAGSGVCDEAPAGPEQGAFPISLICTPSLLYSSPAPKAIIFFVLIPTDFNFKLEIARGNFISYMLPHLAD